MNEPILTSNVIDIQPRIVSRERNLDFGQFFYPQEKRKIFVTRLFRSEVTDGNGNKQTIKAVVSFHPTLGTLNTFDERVFYVLVELWQEQGKPNICYFSERDIQRRLKIKHGINNDKAVRESLTRLRIVGVEWDGSFYHKEKRCSISISNPFTILSHLKMISTKNEGIGSQVAEFSFDWRVIDNLNSNYSRPILLDEVLSFISPLAQALYTHLEPKLYGTNHYHRTSAGLLIEDLGLIGSSYQRKGNRVQYINRAKGELLGKRFYYDEAISKVEMVNSKQDAIFHAYRSGAPKIKGRVINILHEAVPRKEPKRKESQNCHRSPSDNTTTAPKTSPRGSQEALELLHYFTETFPNEERPELTKNDVLKAQEVIVKYGMERARFFIRFARLEADKTRYKPQHFNGIIKYLTPAIAGYERQKRTAKKGEDDAARRRLENARYDHERTYERDYHQYIDEMLSGIDDRHHLEKFNQFRIWQAQERTKIVESTKSDGIKKIQLRNFDSDGSRTLRLCHFFQDDSEIHIPSFWEWDEQHNPNRFSDSRRV